jgi:2'-5' RNA ligase
MDDAGSRIVPSQSAIVVPVPHAEPHVAALRRSFDPSERLGVPAHVTVLYPFVDPAAPLEPVVRRLRTVLSTVRRFAFRLDRVCWFGDDVVWLAPEPDSGFRLLTALVHNAWPDLPPYGGAHDDVVPHLTIGDGASAAELQNAAAAIQPRLPIRALAYEVWLMHGSDQPDSWRLRKRFVLAE